MERTEFELMSTLKLYGMRAAYDEGDDHRHQAPARDTADRRLFAQRRGR